MTYEKALELKNAGYEQFPDNWKGEYLDDSSGWGTHQVYVPILEELIEACNLNGGVFSEIRLQEGKYVAIGYHNKKDIYKIEIAKKPKEAVANLWLALNKK